MRFVFSVNVSISSRAPLPFCLSLWLTITTHTLTKTETNLFFKSSVFVCFDFSSECQIYRSAGCLNWNDKWINCTTFCNYLNHRWTIFKIVPVKNDKVSLISTSQTALFSCFVSSGDAIVKFCGASLWTITWFKCDIFPIRACLWAVLQAYSSYFKPFPARPVLTTSTFLSTVHVGSPPPCQNADTLAYI